jgi:hypothetical protein
MLFDKFESYQRDRPEGKVIAIGSIAAKNITNQANLTNITNVTGNFSNQTQLNMSGPHASLLQPNVNESVMETPTEASAQSDLSKFNSSSLGKDK